jgi:hypothetical protein
MTPPANLTRNRLLLQRTHAAHFLLLSVQLIFHAKCFHFKNKLMKKHLGINLTIRLTIAKTRSTSAILVPVDQAVSIGRKGKMMVTADCSQFLYKSQTAKFA